MSSDQQRYDETLNIFKKWYEEFVKDQKKYFEYLKLAADNLKLADNHSIEALKTLLIATDIVKKSNDEEIKRNQQQLIQNINHYAEEVAAIRRKIGLKIQT